MTKKTIGLRMNSGELIGDNGEVFTALHMEITKEMAQSMIDELDPFEVPKDYCSELDRAWIIDIGKIVDKSQRSMTLCKLGSNTWITVVLEGKIPLRETDRMGAEFLRIATECTYHKKTTVSVFPVNPVVH